MTKIAVVYFSGYGHTKVIAETFAQASEAVLVEINQEGEISQENWGILDQANAIVLVHQHIWAQRLGNLKNLQMHRLKFGSCVGGKIKFLLDLPIVQV